MTPDQTALYERAGELSRLYNERRRQALEEPGPDRPWFFHPLGYWIDVGYTGETPEYDQPSARIDPRTAHFARRIGILARTTKVWENKEALNIARDHFPPNLEFESRRLAEADMKDVPVPGKFDKKEGIMKELEWRQQWKAYNDQFSAIQIDHKVKLLLKWFKEDFFQWVNSPACSRCKGETKHAGVVHATEEERHYTARDVELWQCQRCHKLERFPRYNDPVKLLSTRRGRCGEFANCFSLLVRSTGVPTRWVWNAEDHVWVEYFSTRQNRWIHLDPCENSYDEPLLYARNWRKKMSYCIAFDEYGATDVTRRYVRRPQEEGIPRIIVDEHHVDLVLQVLRNFRRNSLKMVEVKALEKVDREEKKELQKFIDDENKPAPAEAVTTPVQTRSIGRETGTAEWKKARGEDGAQH